MAYVYRHIRGDKNVPFYIGIGNDTSFARAYETKGRNPYWKNVTNKTDYEVEILLDGLTWEEACKKEIEFIALYKRTRDGGLLCNITLGGDGKLGVRPVNAWPKGHVPYTKGKKIPREQVERLAALNRGKPSWNKGITPSVEVVEKQMKTKRERGAILSGERHGMFGKTHTEELRAKWSIERKGREPWNKGVLGYKIVSGQTQRRKIVLQFDRDGNFIAEYESLTIAAEKTGFRKGSISKAILGLNRMKSHKGYVWKYKEAIK